MALGAGVATAHGLYQVAAASGVPHPVAWLYPLITDGLALVAYAATARLHSTGRRYAAVVVVGAAGLSGLAQAVYLAGGITTRAAAPVGLRFGVGFWPAAAAAIAAHLLHLIGSGDDPAEAAAAGVENRPANHSAPDTGTEPGPASNVAASNRPSNPSNAPVFNPASNPPVQPRPTEPRTTPPVQPEPEPQLYNPAPGLNAEQRATGRQSAAERARAAADSPPRPHRRPAHRHRTDAPGRRRPRHRRNRPQDPPRRNAHRCTWSTNRPRKAPTNDHPTLKPPTHDHPPDHRPSTTTHPPSPATTTSPTLTTKITKTKNQDTRTHASRSDGPPDGGQNRRHELILKWQHRQLLILKGGFESC